MSTPLVAPAKPKNARSKRAADARAPQLVEKEAKTAIIARTTGISEKVKVALSELVRPLSSSSSVVRLSLAQC